MSKIRATFISIVPSPYQRDLFAALAAHERVDLRVIYCEQGSPDSPWPEKDLREFEEVLPGFYLSWGGSRFLVNTRIPKLGDSDILVLNGYVTLPAQVLARRVNGRIPMLFWGEKMVGAFPGMKGRVQRTLAQPLERCSGIVAIGRKAHEDYQERYPGKPVFSQPYLCDLDAFRARRPAERPRNPVNILFCGQMIERKGVDLLLQAFSRLVDDGLPVRLTLVGREADLPRMLESIDSEVRKQIDFAGFQAPEDLPRFFEAADIFVLPSRYDGWGVVVNQAVGAGLPVVCSSAVGAAADLVREGENGYIYEPEDVDALSRILGNYVREPDSIRRAGRASEELSRQFDPQAGAARWVEIMERFVGDR